MSTPVIVVDGLGKKYTIGHQSENGRYVALRDVLAHGLAVPFRWLRDGRRATEDRNLRPPSPVSGQPSTDGTFWALKDVSFEVKQGSPRGVEPVTPQGRVVGIIACPVKSYFTGGRNGAGLSSSLHAPSSQLHVPQRRRPFDDAQGMPGHDPGGGLCEAEGRPGLVLACCKVGSKLIK